MIRKFLVYLFYVIFVMALTTSAVWAKVGRCYSVKGGEVVEENDCLCECKQSDRDKKTGLKCIHGCGHCVEPCKKDYMYKLLNYLIKRKAKAKS